MLFSALSCLSVVQAIVIKDHRSEQHVTPSSVAGYPFGKSFSDAWAIGNTHRRITTINVQGCEPGSHVNAMIVDYHDNRNAQDKVRVVHGGWNGVQEWKVFDFEPDEYIKEVRVTTWDKKVKQFRATVYHTRVGYIKFTTSKNKIHECGAYDGLDPAWTWGGDDKALLYFSGSQGDAMDQLQGYFVPVEDF